MKPGQIANIQDRSMYQTPKNNFFNLGLYFWAAVDLNFSKAHQGFNLKLAVGDIIEES
jgi:hypothetical protein